MLRATDLSNIIQHIVDNNRFLEKNEKKKNTILIEGTAGIGKTSIVEQVAQKNGLAFAKINLAQVDDAGEISGFPIREFETKEGQWLNEKHLEGMQEQPNLTGRTRTTYCRPHWVPENETGGILLLDDFTRAPQHIMQACMELVDKQENLGWKLPKDWHIFITSNPADGDYFVTELDTAQATRFIKVKLKFDIQDWSKWAESVAVDGRCINFLMLNPELIKEKVNARLATDFFNSISSLDKFNDKRARYLITHLGSGSVGDEFSQLFIQFIENRLDELPKPEKILSSEPHVAVEILKSVCGDVGTQQYRQDIANILSIRLFNNATKQLENKRKLPDNIRDVMTEIITNEVFSGDINFNFVKMLNSKKIFQSLIENSEIAKVVAK
jgi:hypothetical protein